MRINRTSRSKAFQRTRSHTGAPFALEAVELLEARQLLTSGVMPVAGLDWRGQHIAEWNQGSWILTFNGEQPRAQAEARARQIATAMGVSPDSVVTSALGQFATINTRNRVSEGAVDAAVHAFPFLRNVEPDRIVHVDRVPNDATFGQQWPLRNTGQPADSSGNGTAGADMSAVRAWDITTGSRSVVVAVLDTGTDLTHPDLRPNLWQNPGEIAGDNNDNDGDGFTDDVYGWDFVGNDNNPQCGTGGEAGHGAAVEGCIGGVGNNSVGISGINWQVSMLTCKIGDDMGNLSNAAIINALQYCVMLKRRGINIVCSNNSYGGLGGADPNQYNDAERIAVQSFTDAGMLFIASAGNDALDNDGPVRAYPASYDNPYIVSVAATDNKDQLATFSCFGATQVDLGAPGVRVWTTAVGGGYQYIDGTSFSSPYTAGVVALMASVNPNATKESLRAGLLAAVDIDPFLQGKVATNGRLNAYKAVNGARATGLFVTTLSPGAQAANVTRIDIQFSNPIDSQYFDAANIAADLTLKRANGATTFNGTETPVAIDPSQVTLTGNHLTITFALPLARDLYRLTLRADHFRDTMGNYLNGDTTHGTDEVRDFNVISFRGPYEPNDTIATAAPLLLTPTGPTTAAETLDDLFIGDGLNAASDVDMFSVYVSGPSLISAAVRARSLPIYSSLDSYLRIFDSSGTELAHNDNFDGLDSKLQVFVSGSGTYYISVSAFPNSDYLPVAENGRKTGGSNGVFSLDVGVDTTGPQIITRPGSGTPITIPTQGEITSTINVTDGRSVSDLTVNLNIAHTFVSDLRIFLVGPDGTTVTLFNRRGNAGQNLTNTTFSDAAPTSIVGGVAPFSGTYRPENDFSPFKNRSGLGVWTLHVQDVKPLDSGTLNSWSITFTHVNDIAGPFELNDTVLLATQSTIDGTGANTFSAFIGDGAFGLRDVDLFRFTAGTGTTITGAVTAQGGLKTILRLFDAQGHEVRADRRHAVGTNLINFVVANAGIYYIGVSGGTNSSDLNQLGNDNYDPAVGGSGNPTDATGNYTLTLSVEGGVSEGQQVLSGNRVSVGVNSNGAIGITGTRGLSLDGLDFLLGNDPQSGQPLLSTYFGGTFDGFVVRNTGDRSETDLAVAVSNESDFANRRVVASGVYRSLGVRRTISFGVNDQFIAIDVALTNRSSLVMNNIAWLEGVGARQGLNLPVDNPLTQALTVNNVQNGTMRLSTSSFASGGANYTIGLGVPAGAHGVATGFTDPGVARDPFAFLNDASATPPLTDPDPSGDAGVAGLKDMSVAFNLGALGPNQTVSFRYFLFLGTSLEAVNGQFMTMDSGTGTGHLVQDPKAGSNPATTLPYAIYYPEGFANNRASTFLPIVNASAQAVRVVVIAHYEKSPSFNLPVSQVLYDSATDETGGVIAPGARGGITLTTPTLYAHGTGPSGGLPGRVQSLITGRLGVFKDTPYALEIRSSSPVGASLSHYDFGITTGQAAVSTQSDTWTFAEVQKGTNLNDFIVFYNPNPTTDKVTLTFYGSNGQIAQTYTQNVEGGRRSGWAVASLGLANGLYAAKLDAEQPIVAALTHFNSAAGNGYGTTGLPSAGSTSGGTSQGQVGITATNETVRVLNANNAPATVTVTFAFANASSYRRTLQVPANSRAGFSVSSLVGFPTGQAYSVTYTSTQPVTVSLPDQTTIGTSGSTLAAHASTQWLFGDGFKPVSGNAVQEYLRLYNPSNEDQTIEVAMNYNDGTSEAFRRTVAAHATASYNVFDFITGARSTQGTVPGVGSFYGIRVVSAVPVVAFMGHYDAFLGGGFGTLGTALGTIGAIA